MSGHRRGGGREERRNTDTLRNVSVHVWAPKGGERGTEGERGEEKYRHATAGQRNESVHVVKSLQIIREERERGRQSGGTEGWGGREGERGEERRGDG